MAPGLRLGLASHAPNIPTLVEAEGSPLHLQAEEHAKRNFERFDRARYEVLLLKRLLA